MIDKCPVCQGSLVYEKRVGLCFLECKTDGDWHFSLRNDRNGTAIIIFLHDCRFLYRLGETFISYSGGQDTRSDYQKFYFAPSSMDELINCVISIKESAIFL
jgi:hypothetical protein